MATEHRCLFNISGTREDPVKGVTISGLVTSPAIKKVYHRTSFSEMDCVLLQVLRDTKESFLEDHGTPSGGDWSLPYVAAVTMDGVESISIADCLFTRMDGIAIELLG